MVKLDIPSKRNHEGFATCHAKIEEHIQHSVSLEDQYAFMGADHFDPEEVMKVVEILHLECCRKLRLHAVDFIWVGTGDD